MKFIIVTGLSGAGKSAALNSFEDMGFFCVDNLPPELIPTFVDLCVQQEGRYEKVAIGVDIRVGGESFGNIYSVLDKLRERGIEFDLLYMDADIGTIVRRYDLTRRNHPLSGQMMLEEAIEKEERMLKPLKQMSDRVIDTTKLSARQLKSALRKIYMGDVKIIWPLVSIISFGYKYGVPLDADLIFDMRFLPNPYYIERLKRLTGLDEPVREYVLGFNESKYFLEKVTELLRTLLPFYLKEGRDNVMVAVGCTGGMHRSVAMAQALGDALAASGQVVELSHRDILMDRIGQADDKDA
ncbi:MAG: RNase adapter RapZ [Christensenellales bacterium]